MKVLVAYASRHGATKGIAERIAETLTGNGLETTLEPANGIADVREYDAFVVGAAAYAFHWLEGATKFVRHNKAVLAIIRHGCSVAVLLAITKSIPRPARISASRPFPASSRSSRLRSSRGMSTSSLEPGIRMHPPWV
jgi:flavodoxin-like protein